MNKNIYKAFTLIEVVVSITIFSVIILSMVNIYIVSSDITMKSDINRMMQENIKNVVEKIAEDVRKNGILGVSNSVTDSCNYPSGTSSYKVGDKLCTSSGNNYYLAKLEPSTGKYLRTTKSSCLDIKDNCVVAMGLNEPLTNSYVSVKELYFSLSKDYIPKVTINIVMQPSVRKGIKPDLIKESKLIFQTTISERPF